MLRERETANGHKVTPKKKCLRIKNELVFMNK